MHKTTNPFPETLTYWRVDEVIECLTFGDKRHDVERALMEAMPQAYQSSKVSQSPEIAEWPEPDRDPDRKVSLIWDKLPAEVRDAITAAAAKEFADI